VRTRHPLWDDYDEEYDPGDQRVYDQGRFTIASTWLDAEPIGLARMPEDTLLPLFLTIGMTAFFAAVVVPQLWIALAAAVVCLILMAFWMWPKPLKAVTTEA
jgi:hypothetical protein